jgi:hypothetical protein
MIECSILCHEDRYLAWVPRLVLFTNRNQEWEVECQETIRKQASFGETLDEADKLNPLAGALFVSGGPHDRNRGETGERTRVTGRALLRTGIFWFVKLTQDECVGFRHGKPTQFKQFKAPDRMG